MLPRERGAPRALVAEQVLDARGRAFDLRLVLRMHLQQRVRPTRAVVRLRERAQDHRDAAVRDALEELLRSVVQLLRAWVLECGVWGSGMRDQGLGIRVVGLVLSVQDFGFRDWG